MNNLRFWAIALLALNLAACINDADNTLIESSSSSLQSSESALSSAVDFSSSSESLASSSSATEPMSSSAQQPSSSAGQQPSSSSAIAPFSSSALSSSSSAKLSVLTGDVHAEAFLYNYGGMQFLSLYLGNASLKRSYDSLSLRLYFTAPVGFDVSTMGFRLDIAQRYDVSGFNHPVDESSSFRNSLRAAVPKSLGTRAPNGELEYEWILPLDSIQIGMSERLRLDFMLTKMIVIGSSRDSFVSAPDITLGPGDYSFETLVTEEKGYGDGKILPSSPRLLVYSGSQLVWGTEP